MVKKKHPTSQATPNKPIVVAITGGTCSGKTTLAHQVAAIWGEGALVLSQDSYYHDLADVPSEERWRRNFDLPEALDQDLFVCHAHALLRSEPVDVPVYDFTRHCRRPETVRAQMGGGHPLVVLEGLHILQNTALRQLTDLSVFLECPEPVQLQRRLQRDQVERGRTRADVQRQFREQVEPAYRSHVADIALYARLVMGEDIPLADRCIGVFQYIWSFANDIPQHLRAQHYLPKNAPVLGSDIYQCSLCCHLTYMGSLRLDDWRCRAFDGRPIPEAIVRGRWDHRERWDGRYDGSTGDNGITFEETPGHGFSYEELAGPLDNGWFKSQSGDWRSE